MKYKDLFQTASAGLRRSKARTLLTITALFIGAMTLTLTNGIGTGIKGYLHEQVGELGSQNSLQIIPSDSAGTVDTSNGTNGPAKYSSDRHISLSGTPVMTAQDINTIKSVTDVTDVTDVEPVYTVAPDYVMGKGGKYQLQTIAQQLGADASAMIAGKHIDNSSTQNQIALPATYVNDMGYGDAQALIGKQITLGITDATGNQTTVRATVVGVQQKVLFSSQGAIANTSLAHELYAIQSVGLPAVTADSYGMALASFPSSLTAEQLASLKDALSAKGYNAQTVQDQEHIVFQIITVIMIVLDAFAAITLLAASFGIINTLYMTVQERTKEIGLMKALGMSNRKVFALFSIEAVLIGFWGSVLGVLCAALIGKGVNVIAANGILQNIPGLTLLTFPLTTVFTVIGGIMLLAFLAGTLPALRASKKDPIDALRYE